MTQRRLQILKLIAKGFNNSKIAEKMNLTLSHTKLQKWRLYCYLGVHNVHDAVCVGFRIGLLSQSEVSDSMKGAILCYKQL